MEITHEIIAETLLMPLWENIPGDYKKKYVQNIWTQFENAVKSAAYTDRASDFLSKITNRMGITFANAADVKKVTGFIADTSYQRELLKMLRDDATLLVLLVRVANEEKRELYKKENS